MERAMKQEKNQRRNLVMGCGLQIMACLAMAWPVQAQEPAPVFSLELNALSPSQAGCRAAFVVNNGLGSDLKRVGYEIVLFNTDGVVERMLVLEFQDLVHGKTKVQQFDLPDVDCASVGRLLINDASACEGENVQPKTCMTSLKTSTKTKITFGI